MIYFFYLVELFLFCVIFVINENNQKRKLHNQNLKKEFSKTDNFF